MPKKNKMLRNTGITLQILTLLIWVATHIAIIATGQLEMLVGHATLNLTAAGLYGIGRWLQYKY